jgi:DNA-binding response OmpR family regulator
MAVFNYLEHIIIIDDQDYVINLIRSTLEDEGYFVSSYKSAAEAMNHDFSDTRLIVCDAMNQTPSGLELLKKLKNRPSTSLIPFIILSASDATEDIVAAFDAGVDDYVIKPFSIRELVARIKGVLRRMRDSSADRSSTFINFKNLEVDLMTRQVRDGDRILSLTRTEFAVFAFLLKNRNEFFNRRQIFADVWRDNDTIENDRIVDTNISRLRKKLGDAGQYLVNRSGYGYALTETSK